MRQFDDFWGTRTMRLYSFRTSFCSVLFVKLFIRRFSNKNSDWDFMENKTHVTESSGTTCSSQKQEYNLYYTVNFFCENVENKFTVCVFPC